MHVCIEMYGERIVLSYQITRLEFLCIPGGNMSVKGLITIVLREVYTYK